jgi:dolichol-phosphate mannosyltransferase
MSVVGFISAVLGFVAIGYVLYLKLFTNFTVQGWSSLIGVVLLMGGIQLAALGLIGEYIFRISEQVKNRPLYIVEGHYSKKV